MEAKLVNYYGNFMENQNNSLYNAYTSWRNHPHFGWSNNLFAEPMPQAPHEFQAHVQNLLQKPLEQKLSMEEMFIQFMQSQQQYIQTQQ